MKNIILLLILVSLKAVGQLDFCGEIQYNKTVTLDTTTYKSLSKKATLTPSKNPPLSFIADNFINNTISSYPYCKSFFGDHTTTLYVFPNATSSSDSIMVAENINSKYVFNKVGDYWFMTNFSITNSPFTLNRISCGQTSKEVFNEIGIKIKKPILDRQVWVSNKSGTYKFLLTFINDKLTRIQL